MMTDALQFQPIPIEGRLVSGDHDKIRTTDHERKAEPDRSKHQYEFGVAFPKAQFAQWLQSTLYPYLSTAWAQYPDNITRLNAWWAQPGLKGKHGGCSLKITDGDKPAANGNVSPHTAGHYVVWFTSFGRGYAGEHPHPAEPPQCFAGPSADALVQIDVSQVKRGDYVAVAGTMSPNGKTGDQLGAFMNASRLWKTRDGEAIVGDVDPSASFGGAGLTGTFNPAGGDAGAAFGGTPGAGNPALAGQVSHQAGTGNAGIVGQNTNVATSSGYVGGDAQVMGNSPAPAPGQGQTDPANTQAPGGTLPGVPGQTASPGESPIHSATPHTGILNAGMSPGQAPATGPAPGAAPGLPGM